MAALRCGFPILAGLLLALPALSLGCGEKKPKLSPIIRLTNPDFIAAVESRYKEVLEGKSLLLENVPPLKKLDGRAKWHPFYIAFEMDGTQEELKPGIRPPYLEKKGKDLHIPPGMGAAYVVPVPPEAKVYIECEGSFDEASKSVAAATQLASRPKLSPGAKPGTVRKHLKGGSGGLRSMQLQPSKDGESASGLLRLNNKARSILFTMMVFGSNPGTLKRVRITVLGPVNDFLYKRKTRGIIHAAVAGTSFIEATVRPSLLLLPGTSIEWKAMEIPEGAELRCALGLVDSAPAPLVITMTGRENGGGRHEVFREKLKPDAKGWIEVKEDLSSLSGRDCTLRLSCSFAEESKPEEDALPPLVCCGSPAIYEGRASSPDRGFNLILISLDTLRQDHLGCYGYSRPVSPNMDRFAKEAFLFKNFYAQAPYTLPSHASLFTSLYPTVHGLHSFRDYMPEGVNLLAEILAGQGLATASFNNGGFISHEFGFDRGFDLYCEVDPIGHWYLEGKPDSNPNRLADGSSGSLDRALDWIREMKDGRFFLFLHTFMTHEYLPPKELALEFNEGCPSRLMPDDNNRRLIDQEHVKEHGISKEDLAFFINMYDATIRSADEMVGVVLAHLDALGLADRTVVVVTSDHGEEFMEHGSVQHGKNVYDELIRVPFLIRVPGMEGGQVVDALVNQVDVMPTLLEIMGNLTVEGMQGHSFLPEMRRQKGKPRLVYAETRMPRKYSQHCIVHEGWKYVEGGTDASLAFPAPAPAELFRLDADPGEQESLLEKHPDAVERYKGIMERIRTDLQRIRKALYIRPGSTASISEELKEALRQQGYL